MRVRLESEVGRLKRVLRLSDKPLILLDVLYVPNSAYKVTEDREITGALSWRARALSEGLVQ